PHHLQYTYSENDTRDSGSIYFPSTNDGLPSAKSRNTANLSQLPVHLTGTVQWEFRSIASDKNFRPLRQKRSEMRISHITTGFMSIALALALSLAAAAQSSASSPSPQSEPATAAPPSSSAQPQGEPAQAAPAQREPAQAPPSQ